MGLLGRAVVGAAVVSNARTNRAQRQYIEQATDQQAAAAQQAQIDAAAQQAVAAQQTAAPAPAAAPAQDDVTAQLTQLNNLKNQGIITEEEFAAKKAQILGI